MFPESASKHIYDHQHTFTKWWKDVILCCPFIYIHVTCILPDTCFALLMFLRAVGQKNMVDSASWSWVKERNPMNYWQKHPLNTRFSVKPPWKIMAKPQTLVWVDDVFFAYFCIPSTWNLTMAKSHRKIPFPTPFFGWSLTDWDQNTLQ